MKFSTKGHYGLRAMVNLARAHEGGSLTLTEIAKSEGLSLGYLEQIMAILRKAGLVESKRGAHGGYQLTNGPAYVTVGDILRVLEGPIAPTQCASEVVSPGCCERETDCPSRLVWQRMRDSIAHVLDSTTLADLCLELQQQ